MWEEVGWVGKGGGGGLQEPAVGTLGDPIPLHTPCPTASFQHTSKSVQTMLHTSACSTPLPGEKTQGDKCRVTSGRVRIQIMDIPLHVLIRSNAQRPPGSGTRPLEVLI